ncbi:MAG: AGE family epimerase/isomerase [Planctomycetes bacterium]|nr:AGE family epimerase/isomerase [Planctomycetota bacterium]
MTATDWAAEATRYRDALLDDTLPFWLPRAIDRQHGGFLIMRDRDGTLVDTDKGLWQQARFTWLLGRLHNTVEARGEWLEACAHGIAFLDAYGFDPDDGRMWFHVTRDGKPIRKRRYAFTEAFAAIAYGEHARATGSDAAAVRAASLLQRFLAHEPPPKFTATRPLHGIGVPMIAIATAQELRRSIGLDNATAIIDRHAETIATHFYKPDLGAVMELVGPDGEISDHFDGRTLNPGHAIEAAWFLLREAAERNRSDYRDLGVAMFDCMWQRGWDAEHGGLLYFTDLHRGPVQEYWHDMKFWWPHNEAVLACLHALRATGEPRFAERHAELTTWCDRHFRDREHGEWFGYLHRDGSRASSLKGNLWKGPFHLPRMQLLAWRLCEELAAHGPDRVPEPD